jgi:hypothetical protein
MLLIKRVLYFAINISVAILAFLMIEGIVAYIEQCFWIYSPPFKGGPNSTASRAYMIVLPLIMALFESRLMKRGFIAGWVTRCEIISPMNFNLSFLGCYLRTCFFFLPALIYSSVFDPFRHSSQPSIRDLLSAQIMDVTFLFVILFIPLSVMINRGHQGIHDYILHINFRPKKSTVSFRINILKTLIITTITTVLSSILLYIVIINSSYYKTYIYYMNVAAEHFPDFSSWQHTNEKQMNTAEGLIDSLRISLKQSSVVNDAMIGIDYQIETDKGEKYTVIDIATHLNLEDESSIYMIAHEVALKLDQHEQDIGRFKIKLSKRFVFDIIAFERAVIFNVRKMEGIIQVAIDHDSVGFGRDLPIGFTDSLLSLSGD